MHCHSKYSHDNCLEPETLVNQAIRLKLDGGCFTEQYSYRASWPVGKIRAPEGFRIFREVEISTSHGHLLEYGIWNNSWNQWARDNYMDIFKVLKNVHDMGGICVPAHPFKGWDSFGGSDCHIPDRVGRGFTEFDNPLKPMDELVREIKRGNCQGGGRSDYNAWVIPCRESTRIRTNQRIHS